MDVDCVKADGPTGLCRAAKISSIGGLIETKAELIDN